MQEIKASILKRSGRKYWYIRYQVIFNNQKVSKLLEESTKVGQDEKSLMYMQEVYLPAWIKQKEGELQTQSIQNTSFKHYASLYHDIYIGNRDMQNMEYRLNKILSEFANKDMTSITKLEVRLWLLQLKNVNTQEDLNKSTRNKYKTIFNAIFNLALDNDIIEKNFIPEIKLLGKSTNKDSTKPFSRDEVLILLEKSKDKEAYGGLLHLYLGCAFNQGWSPSEAIGIQLNDITVNTSDQNIIRIQRDITKKHIGDTKNTYRNREIILRDESMPYIDNLITLAKEKNSIWLFSDEKGENLEDISNIRGTPEYKNLKTGKFEHYRTKWYKLLHDWQIQYRPLKNCRHTFTMAMLESNEYSLPALADMLGHKDLNMMIKHYANSIKGKAKEIKSEGILYG